jgi:hypothetical protein
MGWEMFKSRYACSSNLLGEFDFARTILELFKGFLPIRT